MRWLPLGEDIWNAFEQSSFRRFAVDLVAVDLGGVGLAFAATTAFDLALAFGGKMLFAFAFAFAFATVLAISSDWRLWLTTTFV